MGLPRTRAKARSLGLHANGRPRSVLRLRADGFTLFELIVVIILVSLLSGMLFRRFLDYQEVAEKAAMEQTAGAIRSALAIQMAGLIAQGKVEELPKLATLNPVTLLAEVQKNYAGEFYEPGADDIPPGSWYYDLKRKQLVYRVQRGEHFVPDEQGNKSVRYRVSLVYNQPLDRTAPATEVRNIGGVVLQEVEPYVWKVK